MTGPLYRLGKFCVRHKVLVIGVWLAIFIVLVGASRIVGSQTSDNLTLPGTDSQNATDLLDSKFPEQANGTNPIVFVAPKGHKLDESKYEDSIKSVYDDYKNDKAAVQDAVSPFSSDGASQLSKDKTIAYISLTLKDSPSELTIDGAQKLLDVSNPAKSAGMAVSSGGYIGQKLSKPSTHLSEVVGHRRGRDHPALHLRHGRGDGPADHHRAVRARQRAERHRPARPGSRRPTTAPALATMIGLGVGIDYGLFIVTRHRQQMATGMEVYESVARANATSGGAVVFAGTTVIIALLSLLIANIPLVTTLGYTAASVVLIAVLAAITLMPALLGVVGPKIDALKLPGLHHAHDQKPHGWRRWARFVANHPWPCIVPAVVILLVLAAPARNLVLGQTDNGALPTDTQTRQSYDAVSKGFGPGENGPMLVAVDMSKKPAQNDQSQLDDVEQQQKDAEKKQQDEITQETQQLVAQGVPQDQAQKQATDDVQKKSDPNQQEQTQQQEDFLKTTASDPRLQDMRTDMEKTSGVKSVTEPLVNDNGTAAVYTVISDYAPSSEKTSDVVKDLRDNTIPKATKGQDMTADVGGSTAGYIDLAAQITDTLPETIGLVLPALVPAPDGRVPLDPRAAQGGRDEPAVDRRGVRHRDLRLRPRLDVAAHRPGRHRPDRVVRAADDVRDPLRALDGLRGLSHVPRARALSRVQGPPRSGDRRAGDDRPGHHVGGPDHGVGVLRVHPQRRPERQAVRAGDGRRRRGRRDDHSLPAGAGDHDAARAQRLVDAALAGPRDAEPLHRGQRVLRRAGRQGQGRPKARSGA